MIPNNRPKFVVDINIVVSAVLFPQSVPRQALDHAQDIGTLLVSASTLTELQQVLSRSKFDRYVPLESLCTTRTAGILPPAAHQHHTTCPSQ